MILGTIVMALDLRQKFVSAQYLENQLVEFHQILYMHLSWQDLAWECYTSFFPHFALELCSLIYAKISFPVNIFRTDIFSQNFMYSFILTESSLGLLHDIFLIFVPEL